MVRRQAETPLVENEKNPKIWGRFLRKITKLKVKGSESQKRMDLHSEGKMESLEKQEKPSLEISPLSDSQDSVTNLSLESDCSPKSIKYPSTRASRTFSLSKAFPLPLNNKKRDEMERTSPLCNSGTLRFCF